MMNIQVDVKNLVKLDTKLTYSQDNVIHITKPRSRISVGCKMLMKPQQVTFIQTNILHVSISYLLHTYLTSYLCAWCHPPYQFIAYVAWPEVRARAAVSEAPAIWHTMGHKLSITGQSNPVEIQFSYNLVLTTVHSQKKYEETQKIWGIKYNFLQDNKTFIYFSYLLDIIITNH